MARPSSADLRVATEAESGSESGFGSGGSGSGSEVRGESVGNGDEVAESASDDLRSLGDDVGAGVARAGDGDVVDDVVGDVVGDSRSGEPEYVDEDDEFRVRPFWARTSTLVVFVVVLFVLSGAVTAWLRITDLEQQVTRLEAQTLAAEEARQAAILLAQDLATYDYRDLGGNFRHVAKAATPRFAEQLTNLTAQLGPELQQTRAVATATARSAGVVRSGLDKAVVVVLVDQRVTNTRTPAPRVERSRMELTLLREGGVWRLDQAGEL